MTRALLAVIAGLLAGLTGTRYAAALRREEARLRRWDVLLARLSLLMREQAWSLPEAFRQAADGRSEADELLQALSVSQEKEPLAPLPELLSATASALPEAPMLRRLLAGLSAGGLDMRLQAIAAAREEVQLLTATDVAKDAKMWSQLGWLGGACLVVLLI